jgi:hypothetical protein
MFEEIAPSAGLIGRVLALHAQRALQVSLLDTLDEAEANCLVGFRCQPPAR